MDGEPLDPLARAARLDAQHEAVTVDVASGAGASDHGGGEGLAA